MAETLPSLLIRLTGNFVRLEFRDPARGETQAAEGDFVLPAAGDFILPTDQSRADLLAEHSRQLTAALLASPKVADLFKFALSTTIRATKGRALRIVLGLPQLPSEHHEYAWEALRDPHDDSFLLQRTDVYFARQLGTLAVSSGPVVDRPAALVVIANPDKLNQPDHGQTLGGVKLQAINVDVEWLRAQAGLGPFVKEPLLSERGAPGKASFAAIMNRLADTNREPIHVLYLVCHGGFKPEGPKLWLDETNGELIDATRLVQGLHDLKERMPRLVVLASCQSAGEVVNEGAFLQRGLVASLGPLLLQAGIPAVVAMRGDIFQNNVAAMMPYFFRELVGNGSIERAMAFGRFPMRLAPKGLLRDQWWAPILFSQLEDGYLWRPSTSRQRIVYLAHRIAAGEPEAPALAVMREQLQLNGFQVVESEAPPAAPEAVADADPFTAETRQIAWWGGRLLAALGAADAAVLLITQKALDEPGSLLNKEAALLKWRTWRDQPFQMLALSVGQQALTPPAGDPLSQLWQMDTQSLSWNTGDELAQKVEALLAPVTGVAHSASGWRLSVLESRVRKSLADAQLDNQLEAAALTVADEFWAPANGGDPATRWARILLCNGPAALDRLYEVLADRGLDLKLVKALAQNLIGPAQPAWVNAHVAAELMYLSAQAAKTPGAYYLTGYNPEEEAGAAPVAGGKQPEAPADWIYRCYAARACGLSYDNYTAVPWLIVVPVIAFASSPDRLSAIGKELSLALQRAADQLWKESQRAIGGEERSALRLRPRLDPEKEKQIIRKCVDALAKEGRPVLLGLPGTSAKDEKLLRDVRELYGSVTFFFIGDEPAAPPANFGPWLNADLPANLADAYDGYISLLERTQS